MAGSHFCYHCDKEYTTEEYGRHVRSVVSRLSGTPDDELPEFLEEWIAERIDDDGTDQKVDDSKVSR